MTCTDILGAAGLLPAPVVGKQRRAARLPGLLSLPIALLALCGPAAQAAVRLPAVLSDHMVLQRAADVPVWGWAAPREAVTVRFGPQMRRVTAGADGRWRTQLDLREMPASATTLMVRGSDSEVVVNDVLVGEVWFAAGQSNMEKPIGEQRGQKPTIDSAAEIAAADFPGIRLFKVAKQRSPVTLEDVAGAWVICSPAQIDAIKFSAAAYFFGRHLHQALGAPVGLIDATWGGTRIDPWTPSPAGARPPDTDADAGQLFNGMVAGVAPFAIRGALWYQGESNVMEHEDMSRYTAKMEALVQGWRGRWGRDFAFHYVQIAPHLYHLVRRPMVSDPYQAARMQEAQADALRIPGSGMVVTTDLVDDLHDIHPRDKRSVGVRLANLALAASYGRADIVAHGPAFRALSVRGSEAWVTFDHAAGLATRDGKPLSWFDIAGQDGHYFPAWAEIREGKVVVVSPHVAAPVAVRFGWDEAAQPNLVNGAGLPARPFRSQR